MRRAPGTPQPGLRALWIAAGITAAVACGRQTGTLSAPTVTREDSAGIAIVTTTTPAADVPAFAALDSAPDLRLGTVDGPPAEQFGQVRDLAALSDGGVAVGRNGLEQVAGIVGMRTGGSTPFLDPSDSLHMPSCEHNCEQRLGAQRAGSHSVVLRQVT